MRNLGLIGAGYWGKNLARNFDALHALHTICDLDREKLSSYREQYPEVQATDSYEEMLANPEVLSIAIAAPAFQHYLLAKMALEAGKDVFVEKPLCMDCIQGEELQALALKKRAVLMVGHLLHYHPCFLYLKELVASNGLGKLHYIAAHRLNLGAYRTEENALWNFAPHDISMILSLCNDQLPVSVTTTGGAYLTKGVADTTLSSLRFLHGVHAHIYVSWLNPFKEHKLVVAGSSGLAVFDDTKPWKEKLLIYRDHVKWSEERKPLVNPIEPEIPLIEQKEPLREECLHFLACCQQRQRPRTDGEEGLRVLQVLQSAQVSLDREGEAINPLEIHQKLCTL